MSDFVEVAREDEVPVGRARTVSAGGRKIAICHTASGFHALDDRCPHRGGSLGEGDLMGEEIVCPLHFWVFDVRSGRNPDPEGPRVTRHEVRVEGGRVLVRLVPEIDQETQP